MKRCHRQSRSSSTGSAVNEVRAGHDRAPRPNVPNVIEVHSIDDERIALFHDVRNADLRGRSDLFIAESELVVRRLIESRFPVHSLLLSRAKLKQLADAIAHVPIEVPVHVADMSLLTQVAGYRIHGGALALGVRPSARSLTPEHVLGTIPDARRMLLVLAERITHVDNVGALFRNAAAFGADAMVLDSACADPLFRKAIRVSMGQVLSMPFAVSRDWHADLEALKRHWRIRLFASERSDCSHPIHELPDEDRFGIVFGSERHGVSEATLARCDGVFHIPMSRDVPSINVATAAAVVLHQVAQRRSTVPGPNPWRPVPLPAAASKETCDRDPD